MNYFYVMMGIVNFRKAVFVLIMIAAARASGDGDTVSVLTPAPEAASEVSVSSPDPLPVPAPELQIPPANYAGAAVSAFIPGGGQIYQGRYFLGGFLLAAEVTAAGMAVYWRDEMKLRDGETARARDSAAAAYGRWEISGDSLTGYQSGLYSVIADRSEFEALEAKYTAYSALSWALGIHLYGFMDALDFGGAGSSIRGSERNPTHAGLLAAVPFLGLGQLYNGRPGKAGMISMTQISLVVMAYGHHTLMDKAAVRYNEMRDPESPQNVYAAEYQAYWKGRYDSNFSRRNTYLWVSLFAYMYSIFDAVVDAHLSDFDEKIKVGSDLAIGTDGGARVGLTLTLRL